MLFNNSYTAIDKIVSEIKEKIYFSLIVDLTPDGWCNIMRSTQSCHKLQLKVYRLNVFLFLFPSLDIKDLT